MSTKRVLVIDDEADIRAVIQGCLEDIAAWEVVTAQSGEAGVQLAMSTPLDGILLDVLMPGIGGLEALQQLQSNAITRSIPVVLLTAQTLLDDQDYWITLGIAGIIIKPFDPMMLVEQVSDAFGWSLKIF